MDDIHVCMTKNTRLKFLCDWINLRYAIASPGDMFILFCETTELPFAFAWLVLMVMKHNEHIQA
jgi:hypothetical protein